jgi:hypothetical protein
MLERDRVGAQTRERREHALDVEQAEQAAAAFAA